MGYKHATDRHAPCEMDVEAAYRVDIGLALLFVQNGADPLFEFLDGGPGIGDEGSVGSGQKLRSLGDIVFVLDLADDLLDQILDCDEPVGAAEFVDHERQMLA